MRFSLLAALAAVVLGLPACAATTDDATTGNADSAFTENTTTLLISDIDDTIKRTDVLDKFAAAVNAFGTTNEFTGMSTLYRSWHAESETPKKITYLSAAPGPLVEFGIHFLEGSSFPGDTANVRDAVVSGRKFSETAGDFKTRRLLAFYDQSVAAHTMPRTVILVGDNGEQDMIAYQNFIDYVRSKVGATDRIYSFIHHAYDSPQGSVIAAPHRPFVTAADLAVQLRSLALVSSHTLDTVLRDVAARTESDDANDVIPSYMHCAQFTAWPSLADAEDPGVADYETVQTNVNRLCANGL